MQNDKGLTVENGLAVIRDEETWLELMAVLKHAKIIVTPEMAEHLDENFPGWEDHTSGIVDDYDYGSDPDFKIDEAYPENWAANFLDERLIDIQHRQHED